MQFAISTLTNAKLTSINARSEKHGPDQLHPAIDISFTMDAPNSILSSFDEKLLQSLYHNSEAAAHDDGQDTIDGMEEISHLPNLRFPNLGPLKWAKDLSGYTVHIERGLGGKNDIELVDCKVNEFRIDPKEGGTVQVKFRVQTSTNLTEKIMGKLALLVQHEVPIMLTPPEVKETQLPLENPLPYAKDTMPPLDPFDKSGDQKTPEQAFADAAA